MFTRITDTLYASPSLSENGCTVLLLSEKGLQLLSENGCTVIVREWVYSYCQRMGVQLLSENGCRYCQRMGVQILKKNGYISHKSLGVFLCFILLFN